MILLECVTNIIVALLGSGVWVFLLELIKSKTASKSTHKQMLIGLAHDRIYSQCDKYLKRGYVTLDELENLEYLYNPYKGLGGNGTGERLYEAVNRLPHEEKEDRDK